MAKTPANYVDIELLIEAGFNWAEPTILEKRGGLDYTVYLSEPREGKQVLIIYNENKGSWYFRQIEDITEEDGVGLREDEFKRIFEETINNKWEINPRELKGRLEDILAG